MEKEIPTISRLMRAVIFEDYNDALDMVNEEGFDPNEKSKTLESPVISALMNVLSGTKAAKESQELKQIFKAIIANKKFDPNIKDKENETILMHIARSKEFSWAAPLIIQCDNVDIMAKNYMGRTALDIATIFENIVVRDLLISEKVKVSSMHVPKKKTGLKKKKNNKPEISVCDKVLNNIEFAFDNETKDNPVSLYNLVKYFIKGNYDECLRIVKDVHFNPNETDRWDEPALSSLIYYSQDSTVTYDTDKFKEIAKAIIANRMFDVNAIDADCNTVLMVAMGFKRLDWLVRELFKISSARIDVINDMGETINVIAEKCGNAELLSDMIRRSYETANVVS